LRNLASTIFECFAYNFYSFVNFLIRQNINSYNPNRNPVQILFALMLKRKKRSVRLSIDLSWLIVCGVSLVYFKLFKIIQQEKEQVKLAIFDHKVCSFPRIYMLCVSSVSLPAELQTICKEFHKRVSSLEGDKYDLEWKSKMKNLEVKTQPNKVPFPVPTCLL